MENDLLLVCYWQKMEYQTRHFTGGDNLEWRQNKGKGTSNAA